MEQEEHDLSFIFNQIRFNRRITKEKETLIFGGTYPDGTLSMYCCKCKGYTTYYHPVDVKLVKNMELEPKCCKCGGILQCLSQNQPYWDYWYQEKMEW